MRDTRQKIMDAAMRLLTQKGYSDTTTVDIAREAGVNEATLFRQFGSKKEVVLAALEGTRWIPQLDASIFSDATWNLRADLERFMLEYYKRVTPDTVRLSIGLRSPQIYADTAPYVMKVPISFITALEGYLAAAKSRGLLAAGDPHALAMGVFSATLGFVFLQASFGKALSPLSQEDYIRSSVKMFVDGIAAPSPT